MTRELNRRKETNELLLKLSAKYGLPKLEAVVKDENSILFGKDVYVCLHDIVAASMETGDTLENLKNAKNIYNSPVFAVNAAKGVFRIQNKPDFQAALEQMKKYSNQFALSPYAVINTFLAVIAAGVAGFNLDELLKKGVGHIEGFIAHQIQNAAGWDAKNLSSVNPALIMPIGGAGTGKSTFYREMPNVLNLSCDNVRYLLFKEFGPCFASWESTLAWWVVNQLTDLYIGKGMSVFYNGVNTDMEYRSPITMENRDPLYAGIPYKIKLVYFEPPVRLNADELSELKKINLWAAPIDAVDFSKLSPNVAKIMELIKNNYQRTLSRTKEISEGKKTQDPYDILYSVPAAIVKLFIEQSFDEPKGGNVIFVPRREISDEKERAAFYKEQAAKVLR
ncbi:MAG: hypothetical protein CVU77_07770 [Elusimicrobia bacterium HGW-Elusimicrobia-1]|jgi:hypothetical protein|nr:MAG: hypothetical protein CVU77_07770 [Elusimicrobia bacterium HGW-Elusimicrobia-1]